MDRIIPLLRYAIWVAIIVAFNSPLSAQGSRTADRSPVDPADVESVNAIVAAVYDVISGPAGQERNWDWMRSLFIPGGRLIPTFRDSTGAWRHRVRSVDEWITGADPVLVGNGFFERELHRVAERYGNIVHLFSSYDSKRSPEAEPFARGINSFQLLYDGLRWWVVTIFWQAESPDYPIPAEYLPTR